MAFTDGKWEQGTPQPDMQFFIGFDDFQDTSNHAVFATQGAGLISQTLAASLAAALFANVEPYLRTGVYGTDQEQFGTAAGVAGPTAVSNTGGPLGLTPGYPPILGANMATVGGAGIQRGPIAKGMQINSVDVIYTVTGAALTVATIGLTKTVFANNAAPVVTNIIALGANGLPTAVQAQPYVTSVAVTTPAMITSADAEIVLNLNITTQAGGSAVIYGVVFHCSYNFN